jgi:uncharacterized protein (TIGR01244 family)
MITGMHRALAFSVLAFALSIGALTSAQVTKGEIAGITNYSRVDATVGCGGATQPTAMAALGKEGFKSVINLRLANEPGVDIDASRAAAQAAGMKYIHLPFDVQSPDPALVDNFLAAVSDKSNQPVYIHCGSANRVGAVWMIKRVLQDGWDTPKAQEEAEAIGLTNPRLKVFAVDYITAHKK